MVVSEEGAAASALRVVWRGRWLGVVRGGRGGRWLGVYGVVRGGSPRRA